MLPRDTVRAAVAEVAASLDVIALTGGGEALMHPHFWEILDDIRELCPQVRFKMNTSGVALTKEASRLVEYPIDNITISLNAGTTETYHQVVGPNMAVVLEGIATLAAARAAAGRSDLRLCLSMVLMRSTLPELRRLIEIAVERGVEEVQGIYLMAYDASLAHELPWTMPEESNAYVADAARYADQLGVIASLPPAFGGGNRTGSDQVASLPLTEGQRCVEPWSTAYLKADGGVVPCPYFERSMGSLAPDGSGIEAVWWGEQYDELRWQLATGARCSECEHCAGFNETGSVDDELSHWLADRRPRRLIPVIPA